MLQSSLQRFFSFLLNLLLDTYIIYIGKKSLPIPSSSVRQAGKRINTVVGLQCSDPYREAVRLHELSVYPPTRKKKEGGTWNKKPEAKAYI